ncbi:uncharacterized protein [Watersipora subatra]|uniref:uncharacterized protein n=1 Tax=Watersipora subatra TaxID=2589382 RepID=UPI00355C4A77
MTSSRMPVVRAILNGCGFQCLVDTGNERTLVSPQVLTGSTRLRPSHPLLTADGKASHVKGQCRVVVGVQGHCFGVTALVMDKLCNLGVDCLLGGDVIDHMGGVTVRRGSDAKYSVRWGKPYQNGCCGVPAGQDTGAGCACGVARVAPLSGLGGDLVSLRVDDPDFVATFAQGRWTVSWRWSGESPKGYQTRVAEYKCTRAPNLHERYCAEIESWISKGWLKRWSRPIEGIIPLLAVFQPTKDKVRPVMDYRELNAFVESHTGGDAVAVCGEKIRKWRQLRGRLGVVDLKSAYLQIHVSEDLWKYQVVKYKGVPYALTRLGFGLSCAPRIMTKILGKVLSLDERVRRGTDHYIDDIVVQESVLGVEELRKHLAKYGLATKKPEGLDGGRLLGISLKGNARGHLQMSRGTALSKIHLEPAGLTKRELSRFVADFFLKRLGCNGAWDAPVEKEVRSLASGLYTRVCQEDPVRGSWHVRPDGSVVVWTDASSLGLGVAIEVDGSIVEDASWLRKESDHSHINVAKLEAVGRGVNLAIAWGFKTFTLAVDSLTVVNWMSNTIDGHNRVRTKGAAEMLVKRRLGVIRDTITEYGLSVTMRLVPTVENKADRMTRVPKKWLGHRGMSGGKAESMAAAIFTGETLGDAVWAAHLPHHLGVERTLYLAQQVRSDLTREQVKRELAGCEACQRVDPAPRGENLVETGSLAVEGNWCRVAIDVTHYGGQVFLSMIDCGPSRFAIWRRLPNETAAHIVAQLRTIGISLRFRAAYAPSGNGIVERNHRTIKRIAERGRISPEEATFWYNVTPRKGTDGGSVPSNNLYRYSWRVPFDVNLRGLDEGSQGKFAVGDEVWVKPSTPSCTRQWAPGVITGVISKHNVCVDGMPRHVRDVRKRRFGTDRNRLRGSAAPPPPQLHPCEVAEVSEGDVEDGPQTAEDEVQNMDGEPQTAGVPSGDLDPDEPELQPLMLRRLQRKRRRPQYLDDYEG